MEPVFIAHFIQQEGLYGRLEFSVTEYLNIDTQTVERIINYFPAYLHNQIRMELSLTLQGVLSQRLLPKATGRGRVPAVEVMVATPVIRKLLHEGRTLELSNYIQLFGGVVKDVVVLVNAGRSPALVPPKKFINLIKERFDDEFTEIFGIEPHALTANEAQYLAGFRSADALRNRFAAAEQEIDRRLRSKGITRTPQAASASLRAEQGLTDANPGPVKTGQ